MSLQGIETYTQYDPMSASQLNPEQGDEAVLNKMRNLFTMSGNARKKQETRWQETYEFYYGLDQELKKKKPHQSKIFVPRVKTIIDSVVPKLVLQIMGKDPIWTVNPQAEDDFVRSRVWSKILSYYTRRQPHMYRDLNTVLKDSMLYGIGWLKSGWAYCEGVMPVRTSSAPIIDIFTGQLRPPEIVQQRVILEDNPTVTVCDLGEIYYDATASSVETSQYIIHRMLLPMGEVKKWNEYGYIKNFDKIERSNNVKYAATDFMNRRYSTHGFDNPFVLDNNVYDNVEIWEAYHYDNATGLKFKTIIANQNVVLMHKPLGEILWHQRFPFYGIVDCPMTKEFVGVGTIDPIKSLIREQNSLRNQRMDSLNATLKPFIKALRSAQVDKEKLKMMEPGSIIEMNQLDGVMFERPPSIADLTFASEQKTDTDIQLTTGVNDMMIGMPTRSQTRNATTASILDQANDARFGMMSLIALEELRKVGRDWLAMCNQFMSQPMIVRIVGAQGLQQDVIARPEDVPMNPDVYVACGSELQGDMEVKRQQKMQLLNLFMNIPGFNITMFAQELAEDFGDPNAQRFFEGQWVIPTPDLMAQSGMPTDPVASSYKETAGGFQGGTPPQAVNKGDILEMVNNNAITSNQE